MPCSGCCCWCLRFSLLIPVPFIRKLIGPITLFIAESWVACNSGWMALTQRCQWDVQGVEGLDYRSWYLVNSNHQSWVDILVLQHTFNYKIPLLKFFIKQELIWVPVMGLAWWALDFPVHAPPQRGISEKHPEMRGKDQETTRKACEKFAQMPTSVMNFLPKAHASPRPNNNASNRPTNICCRRPAVLPPR